MVQNQRYQILEKLDSGGMAEVFKGEVESIQGFKKQVAIKRILPALTQNRKFMAMFLDEARLSLRLNHANIVQVFDLGVSDNTYFIVMEFVDGVNLKKIIEFSNKRRFLLPIEQSIYILIEVLKGLSYAHELADNDGKILNIVHRDVSPPNVLISKRGEVKLVDFGLAKATNQLERTDPGVVKGKFSYLSPEAVLGLEVDSRADIFASGILLFELLTGKRLFIGETDYHTVQLIKEAQIPSPGVLNPSISRDLEQIVYKALTKDRDQRFQSAREFGDELAHFLFSHGLKVTGFDIANLVASIVEESRKNRRIKEVSIIDQLIQEELFRFTSLDEVNDNAGSLPGSQPLSPEEISGPGQALNPGQFEDPRTWLEDINSESIDFKSTKEQIKIEGGYEDISQKGLANVLEAEKRINIPEKPNHYTQDKKRKSGANFWLKLIFILLLLALLAVAGTTAHVLGYL